MTSLQEPLTPADCNLRDFQFMPMDVSRLLASETWILGTGDERAAAMTLWLESWRQVPAGSVPNDDRMLAHLSQSKNWKKVRAHALRGWVQAVDGRLYHPVVAEKVLEAWIEKLAFSHSGSSGNAKRWGIEIETAGIRTRVITACELLRALAPQSKTLKKKAVLVIAAGSPPDQKASPPESPPDDDLLSPPDSGCDRKGQGQGQGQGLLTPKAIISAVQTSTTPEPEAKPERDHPGQPVQLDRHVQIALLLRSQGVNVTAANPLVAVTWAQNPKVTDDVLNLAVMKAKATLEKQGRNEKPSENYLRPIIEQLVAQFDAPPPAAIAIVKPPRKPTGMDAKGADESYEAYDARIREAEAQRRKAQP